MKTVNIILYEGVAELDFCGPFEALASCRRMANGKWSDKPAFHVETVAEHRATIQCASGLTVLPDKSLKQARESDIILVPGGPGARKETLSPHLLEYLQTARDTAELFASVGTGAFILGRAMLLKGRRATTHSTQLQTFANLFAHTSVVQGPRVVSDGLDLMSSGGMTAGLDLALAMILRYEGDDTARMAAKRLEWNGQLASLVDAARPPARPQPAGRV
jgi:transcriptional regulator GlxA family with amidase domain